MTKSGKHCGKTKVEIARFEQFLLLSLSFQKAFCCRGVRKCLISETGLMSLLQLKFVSKSMFPQTLYLLLINPFPQTRNLQQICNTLHKWEFLYWIESIQKKKMLIAMCLHKSCQRPQSPQKASVCGKWLIIFVKSYIYLFILFYIFSSPVHESSRSVIVTALCPASGVRQHFLLCNR